VAPPFRPTKAHHAGFNQVEKPRRVSGGAKSRRRRRHSAHALVARFSSLGFLRA
uniref:Uncharacterized protein n=1 Tax=Aegilops tauschii subsp. strangulata TaxID=200361 RepID=A0A452YWV7_AEGTS